MAVKAPKKKQVIKEAPETAQPDVVITETETSDTGALQTVFINSKGHGFQSKLTSEGRVFFHTVELNAKKYELECDKQIEVPADIAEIIRNAGLDG